MDYQFGSESLYQGGYSSLNPEYGNFVGYRLNAGELSQSINPATANQLGETIKALKTGQQEVEVQMLGAGGSGQDVDQQIPREHFKELRQVLKLSGARASLHGPILDSAGYGQRGQDEMTRIENERRFLDAIEKAHELNVDKKKEMPVVFHASNGMPGHLYVPDESKKPGEEGRFVLERSYAINRETGEVAPLKREQKYYPAHPEDFEAGGTELGAIDSIESLNKTQWDTKMTELAQFSKAADEVIGSAPYNLVDYQNAVILPDKEEQGFKFVDAETKKELPVTPTAQQAFEKMKDADIFLDNLRLTFSGAFDKAYEYGTNQQKKELKKLADTYAEKMGDLRGNEVWLPVKKKEILRDAIIQLQNITTEHPIKKGNKIELDDRYGAPKIFESTEQFALEKSSETFSNVALNAYKKFKDETPTIAIENWMPGTAFNRAEDLKKLVEESRDKFSQKLQTKLHMNKSKADKIAAQKIGATWDVGHVNLAKKHGFTDEDVVRETETIAPVLKHLHLTDNFGFSDSHLVPGMGNVPFKKHLEKLERAGVLDKVRKVVEAGGYIQQIAQRGVHGETAAAFGSPIYGAKMAAYWNQASAASMGNYFGGYGASNPPMHHNLYGAGFSNLPTELGGAIPGGGSRFSGNSFS